MTIATMTRSGPATMRAGYNAYYAAYSTGYFGANHKPHRQSSPYSNKFQSKQWEKGWQFAQRNHETGKQFSHDPFLGINLGYLAIDPQEKQNRQREAQRKQAEFKARQKKLPGGVPQKFAVRLPYKFRPTETDRPQIGVKSGTFKPEQLINLKRLDNLTKKYRTKV